ncbi:MAG: FapA family protein [Clostridiales bacterium]|jgi:uncharacterized protein (DUF342 family)|nr:FapA family protein [Clostridiales bacterium]
MENDNMIKNTLDILVKEDGVYLYIRHPDGSPRVSRMEVLALIESYGIADVDFVALNESLKQETPELLLKLSSNTHIVQVNESAALEVSADRMEAYITFSAPVNKGELMTLNDVMKVITSAGVVTADTEKVDSILRNKRYERKYLVAEGTQPTPGEDGSLQYHFDNSNLRPKPKIMDDGTVNFRQLGLLRLCNRGDVLVTSIPPKEGKDGSDVYGRVIPHPKGRPPIPIPKGKNTIISEDGLHLIADVNGQLVIADRRINISPSLEIRGNVDNSTGDIEFNGEVTVSGNVITGFTVKATGDIEVRGVCEGARLITDGNIILGNGAQGADKAELIAKGDITAKFIESCKATAGGNIMADSIRNCIVKCDGDVILSGKNGLLVGGSVIAGNKLSAITIGSPMGTATEVEAGNNPQQLTNYRKLNEEYNKQKKDFEKFDLTINALNDLKKKGQLNEDKKNMLLKLLNMKMTLRDKMSKLQDEIDSAQRNLTINAGTVSAKKIIRPGVRVTIGSSQLTVRDELSNCTLRNNGAKISVGPY